MALNVNLKNKGRNIKYLNKDFGQFRENLIEYAKTYFPQTYSDFNEASPGMMFIEMASYLGDVLGYYIDDTLKESFISTAEDKRNVLALSQYLGYKPKVTSPAIVKLSVYQLVPSIGAGTNNRPDSSYYLRIKEGMVCEANSGVQFRSTELLDFNDEFEREITVYSTSPATGEPSQYLIKKYVQAISAELKSATQTIVNQSFAKIELADKNIIDIYDVRDSDGNKWYQVPYLAQEMVYIDYPISEQTDKDLAQFKNSVSNVLKLIKTSKRFTTSINENNSTSIIFGGGTNSTSDSETLIPNFKNVGLGLRSSIDRLGASFDPSNFLKTQTYGQAPSGEMTVSYLVGGGVDSNVGKGTITKIEAIEFDDDNSFFSEDDLVLYRAAKTSVAVDNDFPATGGRGEQTINEIKENALANFAAQNRAVTRKDYQVRALSLPSKFGGIAKAFCAADGELDNNSPASILSSPSSLQEFSDLFVSLKDKDLDENEVKDELNKFLVGKKSNIDEKNNPFAINLYVLGYDSDKYLSSLNRAVKENLKTYLSEFRLLTDGVNLLDGFIINVGVDFEIRVYGGYNTREVLVKCIDEIKKYFNIDDWSFNMPINVSELELIIAGIEGVQSVPKCEIVNKCGGTYSNVKYNITAATKGKMVYPSLDPSVFELKYPGKDIKGRVV